MTASRISSLKRDARFDQVEREAFDLIVIGGGITGAGLAREAALRGLSVALFEAGDFACGTSSRSSKLIHGGLRYLAMGDVGLVREAALERKAVFALAPHLAERRWMVLPTRGRAGLLKFRAAITTYEKLGAVDKPDLHRNWGRDELEVEEPAIDREQYPHACAYLEYLTDDSRLVLANLRAAAAAGVVALNHAPVVGLSHDASGRVDGVLARCARSGREVRARGSAVVNAAGPWIEAIRRFDDATAPPLLHLAKGVHIVLSAERVPVRHLLLLNAADGRSIFALRRESVTYIGTTDTSYEAGAEVWPSITRADVEYLLEPLARYLTVDPVGVHEVGAAWSGLRPLVAQAGKASREMSRKDEILIDASGLVTVAGGKLTGFRPMAMRILESVEKVLGRDLAPRPDDAPLPGGDFDGALGPLEAALRERFAIDARAAARLARLYGCEAGELLERGTRPLVDGAPVFASEVDWAVDVEAAETVEDVLYRRTRAALYEPVFRSALVEPIAERMAERLGWDEARTKDEVAAARARMAAEMAFQTEGA